MHDPQTEDALGANPRLLRLLTSELSYKFETASKPTTASGDRTTQRKPKAGSDHGLGPKTLGAFARCALPVSLQLLAADIARSLLAANAAAIVPAAYPALDQ